MKKYIKQHFFSFCGALLCILVSSLFAVILQFFKGDVLDHAVAGQVGSTISYAVLLICFILLEVFFYFCYDQFLASFVVSCIQSLKGDIFQSMLNRSYVKFKQEPLGEYIAKYTTEAQIIQERYFHMWPAFFEILFKIIFVSFALFLLDWRIAIITLVLLATPLYIPKLISGKLQRSQSDYLEASSDNLAKMNDWLSGFEIIKNFSIEGRILEQFRQSSSLTMKRLLHDHQLSAVAQLITTLISYLSYFIVLVCATWLVIVGDFSPGDFFVAIGMIDQLSYPLISLAQIIRQLMAVKPACEEMEAFLSTSESGSAKELPPFEQYIRFQNVTFGYPDSPAILKDVTFTIPKGTRCLFRGPSGCGKTTAVNLLLRYFDIRSGEIFLDDQPISNYAVTYGSITVLRQDAVLFHDTLRNNLTMYRDVDDQVLVELLTGLGLEKFANRNALSQVIAENGSNLSGGERKCICLARAMLRNTKILILDEPLANLDSQNASLIEDWILSIRDKTVIVVSHQFSEEKLLRFDQVIDFPAMENTAD